MAVGSIALRRGTIRILDPAPPRDVLQHTTLDQLRAHPEHDGVRVWLDYLRHHSYEDVAHRMERGGHVRKEASRRLLRQVLTWVPTDSNAAAWPWARLSGSLFRHEPVDATDCLLLGLAVATGLDEELLDGRPAATRRYLDSLLAAMPASSRNCSRTPTPRSATPYSATAADRRPRGMSTGDRPRGHRSGSRAGSPRRPDREPQR